MNHRDFIYIGFAFLIILWLAGGNLPKKIAILEEAPRVSYDTFIGSQEFILTKKNDRLQKSKSASAASKLDAKEELAFTLWSDRKFDDALQIYKQAERDRKKMSKGYDQKLINTLISLAGLYRDANRLDDSTSYYEKIWQLDKTHLPPNDPRLARDQTSLAVINYFCGEAEQNDKTHEKLMNSCLAHINSAQQILQNQNTAQTAKLANLLYLKELAFRELGEKTASKECRQAADYLTKQLKRPYTIPRT